MEEGTTKELPLLWEDDEANAVAELEVETEAKVTAEADGLVVVFNGLITGESRSVAELPMTCVEPDAGEGVVELVVAYRELRRFEDPEDKDDDDVDDDDEDDDDDDDGEIRETAESAESFEMLEEENREVKAEDEAALRLLFTPGGSQFESPAPPDRSFNSLRSA